MKIQIGDVCFKSKIAALDAIRTILYKYPLNQTLNDEDMHFMLGVLALHRRAAQKIGAGVAAIRIKENATARIGKTRGFWIERVDGTSTDFSFYKCITPPSPESEAKAAFRLEVSDQITAFRAGLFQSGAAIMCPLTSRRLLNDRDTHIDHDPPFEDLLAMFLADRDLNAGQVEVDPTEDSDIETKLADRRLAEDWSNWHLAYASLRAVDRLANLRRGQR